MEKRKTGKNTGPAKKGAPVKSKPEGGSELLSHIEGMDKEPVRPVPATTRSKRSGHGREGGDDALREKE